MKLIKKFKTIFKLYRPLLIKFSKLNQSQKMVQVLRKLTTLMKPPFNLKIESMISLMMLLNFKRLIPLSKILSILCHKILKQTLQKSRKFIQNCRTAQALKPQTVLRKHLVSIKIKSMKTRRLQSKFKKILPQLINLLIRCHRMLNLTP